MIDMCFDNLCCYLVKDVGIASDKHALIIPPFMSRGKRVHPMPSSDASMTCKFIKFVTVL